jgi:hypothetical protein
VEAPLKVSDSKALIKFLESLSVFKEGRAYYESLIGASRAILSKTVDDLS